MPDSYYVECMECGAGYEGPSPRAWIYDHDQGDCESEPDR